MASIKGKGTLYEGQFGWSVSQSKKDKQGKIQIFFIPVKIIKNALVRAANRKFIEFEGFTNHYKTKDGKTMTDFVITHIIEIENSKQVDYPVEQSPVNDDEFILDIDSDTLPF